MTPDEIAATAADIQRAARTANKYQIRVLVVDALTLIAEAIASRPEKTDEKGLEERIRAVFDKYAERGGQR